LDWRENDRAQRLRRQQEEDAVLAVVRERGWLGELLEVVK